MGYSLYPFAVSIDEVKKWFGNKEEASQTNPNKDAEAVTAFLEAHGVWLDGIDKIRPRPNTARTTRECFQDMLEGRRPYNRNVAYKYNYVAYALCLHEGKRLPARSWDNFRLKWFDQVDEVWREAIGMEKDGELGWTSLQKVAERGNPFHLPHPVDFPGVGRLRLEAIQGLLEKMKIAEDTPELMPEGDEKEAQKEYMKMLQTCVELGTDFVVFNF